MKKIIAFIKALFAKKEEVHVGKYAEIKKELIEEKKVAVKAKKEVAQEVPAAPKKKKKKKKTNESK